MFLSKDEEAMATGKYGPGVQKCMEYLIKFGEALGAQKMVKISSAHTMPKEPIELLLEMTDGVTHMGAFTTLHALMSAFSPSSWQKMGIPEAFASSELALYEQRREVYKRVGFFQTYTCLPMLVGNLPKMGDYISWIGSGAQLLSNSVLGARCNRDGTVISLASAIMGRAPLQGLFLDENRYAEVLVRFDGLDFSSLSHADLGAIGYYIGEKAQNRNVVLDGISVNLDIDQLKYLMAPMSVSGSVSICHIVGLTPEAPSLEVALGHRNPGEIITVGKKEIKESMDQYYWYNSNVDMAVFGCPHLSISEIKLMSELLEGKKLRNGKRLWAGTSYQHYFLGEEMGYTKIVEEAGGVFASACMATVPDSPIPEDVDVVATNSFKAAHYITRFSKGRVRVLIGDMDKCIDAVTRDNR